MHKKLSFIVGVFVIGGMSRDLAAAPLCGSMAQPPADTASTRASAVARAQIEQEALANVVEFARQILWPSKNEFGVLSKVGLLSLHEDASAIRLLDAGLYFDVPVRGDLGFFDRNVDLENLRLIKQSRIASGKQGALRELLDGFIVVEGVEEWLFQIKTVIIEDAELSTKVREIQKLLHLTRLVLKTGASEITRQLGMEGDLLGELELTVDNDARGNVSIETVRQRSGGLVFYFNCFRPAALIFMAAVHEVTEAYETVRALRGGMSEHTWNTLLQGLGSSTSRGYFHWKAVEAQIRSAFFATLPIEHQVNFAFELFSIGFGLLGLYRDQLFRRPADSASLWGTIKDLKRLETIISAPAHTALKMDIWERWRQQYGRSARLNAYLAMSETSRLNYLAWVSRFIREAAPKSTRSPKHAGSSSKNLRSLAA
jgi:hypothetical protein